MMYMMGGLVVFFALCVHLAYEAGKTRGMNLGKKQILEEDIIIGNKNVQRLKRDYRDIGHLSDIITSLQKEEKEREYHEVYLREPGWREDSLPAPVQSTKRN